MQPKELLTLFLTGATLVAFGWIPGLLDDLSDEIRTFSARISSSSIPGTPAAAPRQRQRSSHPVLAYAGSVLILIALLASFK